MEKWNEPKTAPPSWLNPDHEVHEIGRKINRFAFVVSVCDTLLSLGCTPKQTFGVCANLINESAWGQIYTAWNLGGVKINASGARAYKTSTGNDINWWRAPGNKAPGATLDDYKGGDPPWCFYRAYGSLEDFCQWWLDHFVPSPTKPAPWKGYKKAGERFSVGDEKWFDAMIDAGYKGPNTKMHPHDAIKEFRSLSSSAAKIWAQSRLGVVVDGEWGTKSIAACVAFQRSRRILDSGRPDTKTCDLLSRQIK